MRKLTAVFCILALTASFFACGAKREKETEVETGALQTEASSESAETEEKTAETENAEEPTEEERYIKAVGLYDSGNLEEAQKLFYALGDYKDSAAYYDSIDVIPLKLYVEYDDEREPYECEYTAVIDEDGYLVSLNGWAYIYDEDHRLIRSELLNDTSGECIHTTEYTYDDEGRVIRIVDTPSKFGRYDFMNAEYDDAGNIRFISQGIMSENDDKEYGWPQNYDYDEAGNCTAHYGSGYERIYDEKFYYDENGRMIKIVYNNDPGLPGEIEYEYNGEGLVVRKTETQNHNEAAPIVTEYSYNEKGERVRETRTVTGTGTGEPAVTVTEYEYDEGGNPVTDRYPDGYVFCRRLPYINDFLKYPFEPEYVRALELRY